MISLRLLILLLLMPFITAYSQIENVSVSYEENALHLTWDVNDSTYYSLFYVFYAEAEVEHFNMLDSALYWGMTFPECWEWHRGYNMNYEFFITPNRVFEAYTSLIRLGVLGARWICDNKGNIIDTTYSTLFLAPDIINRTPQRPLGVDIK